MPPHHPEAVTGQNKAEKAVRSVRGLPPRPLLQHKHIQTGASPGGEAGSSPTRAVAPVGASQEPCNFAYEEASRLTGQDIQTLSNKDLSKPPETLQSMPRI